MRYDIARKMHADLGATFVEFPHTSLMLWETLQGRGRDLWIEAVSETMPGEFSAMLRTNDTAAAYAHNLMWDTVSVGQCGTALQFRDALRSVWEKFSERAKETKELQEGFGWDHSSAWKQTREIQCATGDLEAVKRIARLAGRMYAAMRGGDANKVRGVPQEVYSVELGNNVGRLLCSEQAFLADNQLEIITLQRLAAHKATQYAMRGTDKRSKGPLVICLDESASMHGYRNEWAKAAAVALARVAQDENRKCAVVHFSTSVYVQNLDNSAASIGELIRHFFSGGTNIAWALAAAAEKVQEFQSKIGQASDVILVSDGVDGDVEGHLKSVSQLKKIGARLWTVGIDVEIPEDNVLRKEASEYTHLDSNNMTAKDAVSLGKAAR